MANTINIPKTHLIMGLSLPLAVLLGYFLAEPLELGSMAVVVFVLVVLSLPLMMKWYHPLLVFGWNAAICPAFLPGRPHLWAMLAFLGLLFAVLNRAVRPNASFVLEPSVIKPLLLLTGVVVATGMLTGGFGLRSLGASRNGGQKYFYFLAAVAGYFVFTSKRISPQRAPLYVALFFLSALTYGLSDLANVAGSKLDFLWLFLPSEYGAPDATTAGVTDYNRIITHHAATSLVGIALYSYLFARFGIRGLLDLTRPWRLLLLLLALVAGLLSGFRGFAVACSLTFAVLFCLEGLHRTRYLAVLLGVALLGGGVVLPYANKLPLGAQRTLSFLPGNFDYAARENARSSSEWRVEMWKQLLPEVPKRLFRGQGWGIDARELEMSVSMADAGDPYASIIMVGNYHNGPLSILLPFGIYGMIAFVWFLVASLRLLHRNWKFGNPALHTVNAMLFAAFASRAFSFFLIFGALESDMVFFTGLLGLGVALNGAEPARAQAEQPATGVEFGTEYIKA
jgi:O-antigen ligase